MQGTPDAIKPLTASSRALSAALTRLKLATAGSLICVCGIERQATLINPVKPPGGARLRGVGSKRDFALFLYILDLWILAERLGLGLCHLNRKPPDRLGIDIANRSSMGVCQ